MASCTQSQSQWDKLSPNEFQQLQDLASCKFFNSLSTLSIKHAENIQFNRLDEEVGRCFGRILWTNINVQI